VSVLLGIGVATLVYGDLTFVTVSLGAISPLALAALERTSLAVATMTMCALWLLPRFVLADTLRRFITLASVSIAAACVAGSIFAAYLDAPLPAHAASCVFAGSCLALVGILVSLPTPTSHALGVAAATIAGPSHDALTRAAAAHERSRWQPRTRQVRRQWDALLRLSDERAAREQREGAEQRREIDQRIEAAVRELAPSTGETVTSPRDGAPEGATTAPSEGATAPVSATPATGDGMSDAPCPDVTSPGGGASGDTVIDESEEVSIAMIDAHDGPPSDI
jgi:hypothetical protein